MRRNREIKDYITKISILRNDVIDANGEEIIHDTNEECTVKEILQGIRNYPEWAPFCTTIGVQLQNSQKTTIKQPEKLLIH